MSVTGLPVISIGILLRPDAAGAGATGRIVLQSPQGMTTLDFSYTLLRVWEVPAEQFLTSGEALLPLAPLGKIAKSGVAGLLRRVKARLARILPQTREKKLRTATYILMGLKYTADFIDEVWGGTTDMKESVTYQKILREGLEEGREQGRELGIAEGRQEGEVQHAYTTLLRLGQKRFGAPSSEVVSILTTISDVTQLDALTDRIQEVENWNELLSS